MDMVTCAVCGGEAGVVFRQHPGYQKPHVFDIARCDHCHTSFALAEGVDTKPVYDAIYRNASDILGYSSYVGYAKGVLSADDPLDYLAEQHPNYWAVREHLNDSSQLPRSPILEIGSGLGYLTYALNRAGYSATGIDVSQMAVAEAIKLYGGAYVCADLFEYAAANEQKYAKVILTEVIEHLPDIYPFLEAAMSLLVPGGEMIITTPNRDQWASDVIWGCDPPPVHLWWFSTRSFQQMARHLGQTVSFVELGGHSEAADWHLQRVEGSPCVVRPAMLSESGKPIQSPGLPRVRPRFPLLSPGLKAAVKSRLPTLLPGSKKQEGWVEPTLGEEAGFPPTIVAVMHKAA